MEICNTLADGGSVETTTTNVPKINGKALVMSLRGVHKTVKKIPADTVIVSVGYTSDQTCMKQSKVTMCICLVMRIIRVT